MAAARLAEAGKHQRLAVDQHDDHWFAGLVQRIQQGDLSALQFQGGGAQGFANEIQVIAHYSHDYI